MALEIRSPGVYSQEVNPSKQAEALSPAKMGICGWTNKGPSNFPIQVASVDEFTRSFGPLSTRGIVPLSMRAFFGSGGEKAWVSRVVPADATNASVDIDPTPGPTKWTFTSNGEGIWGNDLKVRVRGNRNFLDRTTKAWEKFDVLILQPTDFDPTVDEASEVYEQVQFTDSSKFDYVSNVINDPRKPSLLIKLTAGATGTPTDLLSTDVASESIGTGGGVPLVKRFTATLAQVPILDNTLIIKAVAATVNNQTQTVAPAIDGVVSAFTANIPLANLPVVEGSLKLFYQRVKLLNQLTSPSTGAIDGANKSFTFAADLLASPVHREISTFRLKYGATAGASPQALFTVGASPATYSLATTALTTTPVHPGTVSIAVNVDGVGLSTITDNAAGLLVGNNGSLPLGGTINYDTGVMTGVTALLAATSTVIATYNKSNVITKRAQVNLALTAVVGVITTADTVTVGAATGKVVRIASGQTSVDVNVISGVFAPGAATFAPSGATATVTAVTQNNLAQGVDLIGSVDGTGVNTINLVDSESDPVGSGAVDVKTLVAPLAGTFLFFDYVALGIARSSLAGILSGDVTGTSTVNFDTGAIVVTFSNPPLITSTVEASYQTGQLVRDNGLGKLVGDVDANGNNTIDYTLGTLDVTFATAPTSGTPITAAYTKLADAVQFQLSGGSDGSAVSRADITDPTLSASKKGIFALDSVEEPLNLVVPDFEGSAFAQQDVLDFCEARINRYAILSAANGTTVDEILQYVLVTAAFDSKVGAFYYPNINFLNEATNIPELMPSSPFVAGIYAKTARNKNVGKSPGGIVDGALDAPGVIGPEVILTLADRDRLYQSRINPLLSSAGTGFVVWGVRSLSREPLWRYVSHRLLQHFLRYRIGLLLNFAVFENNGPALWARISATLDGYMSSLFRLGYFGGNSKAESFSVTCNSSNNSDVTISKGLVIIDLSFLAAGSAEFIRFNISKSLNTATIA